MGVQDAVDRRVASLGIAGSEGSARLRRQPGEPLGAGRVVWSRLAGQRPISDLQEKLLRREMSAHCWSTTPRPAVRDMFASTTSGVGIVRSTGSRTPKLRYRWIARVVPDLCRVAVHTARRVSLSEPDGVLSVCPPRGGA